MKKLLLTLVLLLPAIPAQAALKVFACESEWGALAKELGGDNLDIYVASTALQDVHKVQPKPSLIAKYRQADLLVCTGAELEIGWLPPLAEKGNNPKVNPGAPGFFEASRSVSMLDVPARFDRSEGDIHPFGNPHIQTSPANILPVAKALTEKLAQLDGAHGADYRARLAAFSTRWEGALAKWKEQGKPLAGVAVVSHHKTWIYLYRWLGINEITTLEPKPGIPPSGAHLEEILASLKAQPAKMVVRAAYEDARASDWLSRNAGIPAVTLPFSVGGAPGADDLFGFYDVTLQRLLAGLAGKAS